MFIAHAPSGYILSITFLKKIKKNFVRRKWFTFWGVLGAFAPDFDMLYYYLIDNQQTLHHKYFTHWTIVWMGMIAISACGASLKFCKKFCAYLFIFSLGGLLHIILDGFVGGIY